MFLILHYTWTLEKLKTLYKYFQSCNILMVCQRFERHKNMKKTFNKQIYKILSKLKGLFK